MKKQKRLWGLLLAVCLLAGGIAGAAGDGYNGYPGYGGNGGYGNDGNDGGNGYGGYGYPFGNMPGMGGQQGLDGQQYPGMAAAETVLTVMPSSRSVRSGETMTLDYDLQLSQEDMERISVIQQGAELEYRLKYYAIAEQTAPGTDSGSSSDGTGLPDGQNKDETDWPESTGTQGASGGGAGTQESGAPADGQLIRETDTAVVSFSMNRENNERCTLTIQPTADETCTMKVEAVMTLRDGKTISCTSDAILIYTAEEIRSHMLDRDCEDGGQAKVAWMILGPEGNYSFRCYSAVSDDEGQTWFRTDGEPYDFTINTHQREPNITVAVPVKAGKSCMLRVEAEITLPDGRVLFSNTDPVRVSLGGTQL